MRYMLDLAVLRAVNQERARYWHLKGRRSWSTLEWAGAMCGEAGEAANVAKKILRVDLSIDSANNEDRGLLKQKLAKELADTIIYADLVAASEGIDLAKAVVETFNQVSDRENMPHFRLAQVTKEV